MNFEIYFEIEEFEADKPFYYIKGGSKVRLSKNVFRTFHNILIKICISFLVEILNFVSLWYQDCFEDMPRRDFGWSVKVSLRKNELCTFTPVLNPDMPPCIMTGKYCACTILSRGLHISIYTTVYNQERLILQTIYVDVLNSEILQ